MKKLFLFIAGLGFLAAIIGCLLGLTAKRVFADERFTSQSLKGSGRIVARTQNIPAFKAIDSSRGIRVTVTEAPQGAVRIEADDNLLDKVIAEVRQGTLKIGIDKSVKNLSDYHIKVTVPYNERIGSFKASSASSIVCDRPLKAGKTTLSASSAAKIETAVEATTCKIDASSAAKIVAAVTAGECEIETSSASKVKATVTARKCTFDASSASKIEAKGQATRCEASLNSASKLSAEKLDAETYDIETSSGASARIRCTGMLKAEASSGSSIRYSGDCSTRIEKSSGGSIQAR